MGQKITEHPQVEYWVKLMREVDQTGATVPVRETSDKKELSQYAEMNRARHRTSYSVPDMPWLHDDDAGDTITADGPDTADAKGEKPE